MRPDFDKEMDSLLRRQARAGGSVSSDGAAASRAGAHLDADELAAFAGKALPASARSHYVSHLADCEGCRLQVAALASGMEYELEKSVAAERAEGRAGAMSFKDRLAALFSPRVLRYVAPALALVLIGTVTFIILRSNVGDEPVAQRTGEIANEAPPASKEFEAGDVGTGANTEEQTVAQANLNSSRRAGSTVDERGDRADAEAAARTARESSAGRTSGGGETNAASAPQPESPKAMTLPLPPAPSASTSTLATNPSPAASESARREAGEMKVKESEREGLLALENARESRAVREEPARRTSGASVAAPSDEAREDRSTNRSRQTTLNQRSADDSLASSETRTIAGHRFQRRDGMWVDVNYRSGMPSSSARRGTESFRSLVADMPEIGRAAEVLGEEFIIVVRGRAYRIR